MILYLNFSEDKMTIPEFDLDFWEPSFSVYFEILAELEIAFRRILIVSKRISAETNFGTGLSDDSMTQTISFVETSLGVFAI